MINIILNSKEYTLVDVYDFNEEKIYHYKSDEDDLFYKQINNKLHLIKDIKVIKDIKKEFDLNNPEFLFSSSTLIYQTLGITNCEILPLESKNHKIDLFIERLKFVKELKLDFEKIKNKLSKVSIFEGDIPHNVGAGMYHPVSNNVIIGRESFSNSEELEFHELVHASSGNLFCMFQQTGFVEGMTDSLTERVFNNDKSSIKNDIKFNFSNRGAAYLFQIAIIRQMEEALKELSCESVLNGDDKFLKKFGDKYGKDLLRYLGHRTTRLIKMEKQNDLKMADYFKETQNELMTRVFTKDFENIKTIQDMQLYFDKLDKFQLVRGRYKKDSFYKVFYEKKYKDAVSILEKNGLSNQEIENALGQYKYNFKNFKAFHTEEEINKIIEDSVGKTLVNTIGNNVKISNIKCFKHYDETNNISIYMVVFNGEVISVTIGSLDKNIQYYKQHFASKGITINNNIVSFNGNSYEMEEVPIDMERIKQIYENYVEQKNAQDIKRGQHEALIVNEILDKDSKQLSESHSKNVALNNYLSDYSTRVTEMFQNRGIDLNVNFSFNCANLVSSNSEILNYIKDIIGSTEIKYDKSKSLISNLNDITKLLEQVYNEFNKEMLNNVNEVKQEIK